MQDDHHQPRLGIRALALALVLPLGACGLGGGGSADEAGEAGASASATGGAGGTRVLEWAGGTGGMGDAASIGGRSGGASLGGRPADSGGGSGTGGSAGSAGAVSTVTGGAAPTGGAEAGGAAGQCVPRGVASWAPPAYVPARAPQNVCIAAQIQAFTSECLLGGDCAAFAADGPSEACAACLAPSALDAGAYGPVLVTVPPPASAYGSNTAGCIELVGEPDCARAIQAADACARAACEGPCAPAASLDLAAYYACMAEARVGVCAAYQAATSCVRDPAHAAACSGTSFQTIILAVGTVFCAGG